MCIYIYIYIHTYMYLSIYLSIYLSLSLSLYIYIYTHVYIYIYIYIERERDEQTTFLRIKIHVGTQAFRVPNQGLECSACWWFAAGQALLQKEYYFHRHRQYRVQSIMMIVKHCRLNNHRRPHRHPANRAIGAMVNELRPPLRDSGVRSLPLALQFNADCNQFFQG